MANYDPAKSFMAERKMKVKGLLSTFHSKPFIRLSVEADIDGPTVKELEEIKVDILGPVYATYSMTRTFGIETGHVLHFFGDDPVKGILGGDL